jgi:hypothetical protein
MIDKEAGVEPADLRLARPRLSARLLDQTSGIIANRISEHGTHARPGIESAGDGGLVSIFA